MNGTEVTPGQLTFKVETSLRQPTAADARPVTAIEQLPGPPASDPPIIFAGVSLLVALLLLLAVVLVAARKRKAKPIAPGEWVRERLGSLQVERSHGRLGEPGYVTKLAEVFREYLTRRFGLRRVLLFGMGLVVAGLALFATVTASSGFLIVGIAFTFVGIGMGLALSAPRKPVTFGVFLMRW